MCFFCQCRKILVGILKHLSIFDKVHFLGLMSVYFCIYVDTKELVTVQNVVNIPLARSAALVVYINKIKI